ncbi:MAG: caspase family protein [Burkholderiales bacterium]
MATDLMFDPLRRRVLRGAAAASALALLRAPVFAQSGSALHSLPRHALVIGNARYLNAPLDNPVNDAKAIAAQLKATGFDVALQLDAGREALARAIDDYVARLASRKAVGLFYFAGHGVQLAWRNYLIPVDAVIQSQNDIAPRSVELNTLLQGLAKAANPMNVVILDACRDNPFGTAAPLEQKGLSQFDAPPGSLLAYATAPGNVASDGADANGLYTESLLRELKVPGAKIEDVFKRVRLAVRRRSNGQQIPWESTSLEEDFYFQPPKTLQKLSETEVEKRFEEELAIWEHIKAATDAAPIEDYLRRYPSGVFSEIAQLRLDQVLAQTGERKIQLVSSEKNPFSKGTAVIDTRVKIGDRFRYREIDLDTQQETRQYTLTVAKVTDTEVFYGKGNLSTDLLGNWIKSPDGRQWTGAQYFIPDYSLGKRWASRHRYTSVKGNDFSTEYDLRVVARERVKVPAGEFDAFRVDGNGWLRGATGAFQVTMRYWVTPGVRRFIAMENTRKNPRGKIYKHDRLELMEFCCG